MKDGFVFTFDTNPNTDMRSGLDPRDYKYLAEAPDPNFSPERNRAVIQETINEATKYHNDWSHVMTQDGKERLDVLSHYATYTLSKGGSKGLKAYLGTENYNKLVGEQVLSRIRSKWIVDKLGKPKKG